MKNYSFMALALAPLLVASVDAQSMPTLNDVNLAAQNNQKQIATNKDQIAQYHHEVRQTASQVLIYSHTNDNRVKSDEGAIDNNYNEIQKLKKRPASNLVKVQNNKTAIDNTNQLIGTDESKIQANQQRLGSLDKKVISSEKQIENNTKEIKGLRQDLERMASDINGAYADAAAMNGLTEPYNVGSVMVSVGVGHHGNADAVAFGMGERFNEHVTAKAGASLTSSSSTMTTYAGIGYEF